MFKLVKRALLCVYATFNNTIITFCDLSGKTIAWSSSGKNRFKGAKKATPFAAQVATESLGTVFKNHAVREVFIRLKGLGLGRDSVIRTINNMGLKIISISDVTPIPHNGCRPPKKRRI